MQYGSVSEAVDHLRVLDGRLIHLNRQVERLREELAAVRDIRAGAERWIAAVQRVAEGEGQ